jgi:uncharacterized protein
VVSAPLTLAISAQAEPAMWVIRDKDSTIYLVGTIHLLRPGAEWDATKVRKTVTESSELWLEVSNIDDQASTLPLVNQYGMDPKKTLSSRLNPAQKEKLDTVAASLGIPPASLEPMRPWMAALTFSILPWMKAGYDPNAGVDHVLRAQAEKEGDKIYGFETAEEQIRFLADLPEAEQIAFLEQTLDEVEKGVAQVEKLAKAWMDGDNETIGSLLVTELKQEAPALYQKLVVQRNIAWSKKIAGILKGSGVQQIAVGAAHLVGPDSVQVQLAKLGIKAERY